MVRIREATLADSEKLAAQSGQLGYPADAETIARRLRAIVDHGAGVVLVAESVAGAVVGWAHAMPERALVCDVRVQLAGLVVAEDARGGGIGTALLHAAEGWARAQGFAALAVRSNVIRSRAHRFYLRAGYVEQKRQAVFTKAM
ncbi:MAG TPA: GNAT family N-acetyltransferase [Rhodanobacteraceae bacterium]|nr:GNAT family N-acetyltransferase [Rhodanobacteraceae bacterium]